MGCLGSKIARCRRCNRSEATVTLTIPDHICLECIREEQKLIEYRRRLAALRDDTTTTSSVPTEVERISIARVPRSGANGQPRSARPAHDKPLYGEYKCTCGRAWSSRCSWRHTYQKCKRCKKCVYPYLLRELVESDKSNPKLFGQEHPEHLCGKCLRLGYRCNKRSGSNTN